MKTLFTELFEYSHHYNQKLYDVFKEGPDKTSEKAVKLFNHILNAHHIWNHRIEFKPTRFGVWEMHALQDLKSMDQTNYEQTLQILDACDFQSTIHYVTSNGQPFSNTIRDILFHTVNHSTYHRGQIATAFKLNGLDPLATDYILFKR